MKRPTPKQQQALVDKWNVEHPGTDVDVIRYKLINPLRDPVRTTTRSPAWLMGGHTAMIMVNGTTGAVALESVIFVPKA